jgi:DNA anti-recombination protein RmuC
MSGEFFTELLDFGALGLFAGFLVWLYVGMQKRMDALVDRFQDQLNQINADYDDRVDKMRERLMAMSAHKVTDIKAAVVSVEDQVEKNAQKLDSALVKLDEGLKAMKDHYAEAEIYRRIKEARKE